MIVVNDEPVGDEVFIYHLSGLISSYLSIDVLLNSSDCQAAKAKREVIFKRAEAYVKEYQDGEREQIRLKRLAKKEGNFYVPSQPKLVFVVRIKGYQTLSIPG